MTETIHFFSQGGTGKIQDPNSSGGGKVQDPTSSGGGEVQDPTSKGDCKSTGSNQQGGL